MAKDRKIFTVIVDGQDKPLVYSQKELMLECQLNPLTPSVSTTYWRRRSETAAHLPVKLAGCTIWEDVLRERHIVEKENGQVL